MNITLANTLQNTRPIAQRKNQHKNISKTVTFQTERNDYIEPTP